MRTPQQYAVQRRSQVKSFAAPVGGWIANRNYALPNGQQMPPGAFLLENWFPTSRGARLRRGSELYCTLGDGTKAASALFSYVVGSEAEIFGATQDAIYNITTILTPYDYALGDEGGFTLETDTGDIFGETSTESFVVVDGQTGGNWVTVQFATSGGIFLVCVNGADDMLIYDGTTWYPIDSQDLVALAYDGGTATFTVGQTVTGGTSGATATIKKVIGDATSGTLWLGTVTGGPFQDNEAITDGAGGAAVANGASTLLFGAFAGIATSQLSYVWSYKNRLFFIQKESLSVWYLDAENLTGTATEIPFGGVFNRGGSLLFGSAWALDSGSGGSGLSEQCVFVTTEGEVAVYQGDNPGSPDSWALNNTYRIGKPLGYKAHIRAGGDLVIATTIGFVPLSQAVQRDFAALSPSAVSYPIEDAWNEAVLLRGASDWNCEVWPSAQMVIVAPPTTNDQSPQWYVANARTGAWAPFTDWDATCVLVFQERCFYGSANGKVVEANVTGTDQGSPYTASYVPLFDDFRSPAALKFAKMARVALRAPIQPKDKMSFQADFEANLPTAPNAAIMPPTSTWGAGTWGESVWGEATALNIYQSWRVVVGNGYSVAPGLQITSGDVVPLDAEIVRTDLAYEIADMIT